MRRKQAVLFEEKNQKLLFTWLRPLAGAGPNIQKLFASFFSKKKVFLAGLNRSASRALGIIPNGFAADSCEESKQFFFEKKAAPAPREPKNFCSWGFGLWLARVPISKSF